MSERSSVVVHVGGAKLRKLTGPLTLLLSLLGGVTGCSKSAAAQATEAATNPSGEGVCGDKDLPDCPLQQWMKATLKPYVAANDTARLTAALEQLAEKAPPGFDGWRESAQDAAKAAKNSDIAAVKAGCKHCHDTHRNRFRKERRTVAMF
jgi:hypothetical protein